MRYLLIFFSLLVVSLSADVSKSFKVEGMHCGYGCVNKVKAIVNSLDGVKKCEVDFNKSLMVVEFEEEKLDSDKIILSLNENTTYQTTKFEEKKPTFWSKFKGIFKNKS
tara:strand:- start:323 stop:649 length:327 start_codon:yes stop_codon:yes gene_type:complete